MFIHARACVCTRYTREHGRASITRRRVPACFIPFAIFHILPTRVRNASVVHSSDALPPRHRCRCSAIYGPGEHPNRLRGRRILRFLRRGKHLALEMPAFQLSLSSPFLRRARVTLFRFGVSPLGEMARDEEKRGREACCSR